MKIKEGDKERRQKRKVTVKVRPQVSGNRGRKDTLKKQ
jgi:hypothetical protein